MSHESLIVTKHSNPNGSNDVIVTLGKNPISAEIFARFKDEVSERDYSEETDLRNNDKFRAALVAYGDVIADGMMLRIPIRPVEDYLQDVKEQAAPADDFNYPGNLQATYRVEGQPKDQKVRLISNIPAFIVARIAEAYEQAVDNNTLQISAPAPAKKPAAVTAGKKDVKTSSAAPQTPKTQQRIISLVKRIDEDMAELKDLLGITK